MAPRHVMGGTYPLCPLWLRHWIPVLFIMTIRTNRKKKTNNCNFLKVFGHLSCPSAWKKQDGDLHFLLYVIRSHLSQKGFLKENFTIFWISFQNVYEVSNLCKTDYCLNPCGQADQLQYTYMPYSCCLFQIRELTKGLCQGTINRVLQSFS